MSIKIFKKTYPKRPGIEYDIEARWEEGIEHDPISIEILKRIKEIDRTFNNNYFNFQCGGDGDNGEELMYLLDIYFEEEDWINSR